MSFPFFRKKDRTDKPAGRSHRRQEPAELADARRAPASSGPPVGSESIGLGTGFGHIEVTETAVRDSAAVEEAVICFANGQTSQAIAALQTELRHNSEVAANPDLWLMLLELYQIAGMQPEYEKTAVDFVLRFERSAPAWRNRSAFAPSADDEMFFSLFGPLSAASRPYLDQLAAAEPDKRLVHLDVTRLTGADGDGSRLLREVLNDLRRRGHRLFLAGAEHMTALLDAALRGEGRREREFWLLLLEVYAILDRQKDFENLAVDFAVHFEVSPPSWEPLPPHPRAPALERRAETRAGADDFVFHGEVRGAADSQLQELAKFAEKRRYVNINMGNVVRLDFVAAGMLLNLLSACRQKGQVVRVHDTNELIFGLLEILGITDLAMVTKGKRH